tara:strand:+ start:2374 stop:3891 length:1518 start_codon:yes stop_codon:yes gene_type:complete
MSTFSGTTTFVQYPVNSLDDIPVITNWTPLIGYMVHCDDITGVFYFKLILEVRADSNTGTLLGKIKQRRNGYSVDVAGDEARAFFDLKDIVNSYLVDTVNDQNNAGQPFVTIHKIGDNTSQKPFSASGDRNTDEVQIARIYVKAYQQYSESAGEVPSVDDTSTTVNDTLVYTGASLPLFTERDTSSDYVQSDAFGSYTVSGSSGTFLSDNYIGNFNPYTGATATINKVQWNGTKGDYHTLAFLNDNDMFGSDVVEIKVKYYNATSGTALSTTTFDNMSSNGGWEPDNSEATTPADPMESKYQLLYFGCGPGNLEGQSLSNAHPSDGGNSGWAYYTVQGFNASGSARTNLVTFLKDDGSCKGFKVRRLAWRNSLGCYDYFNFKMKSVQTFEVERNNYNTMLGTFNKSRWRYNDTQRGKTTRKTTTTLKETLHTDWLNEEEAGLVEKLIMSSSVYVVENADTNNTQGVIVNDSSFTIKTIANNKLIQYTINIEYSNAINQASLPVFK